MPARQRKIIATRKEIERRVKGLERFDSGDKIVDLARKIGMMCLALLDENKKNRETMNALMKTAQGWIDNCPQPEEHKALKLKAEPCPICEDIKADFIAPLKEVLDAR